MLKIKNNKNSKLSEAIVMNDEDLCQFCNNTCYIMSQKITKENEDIFNIKSEIDENLFHLYDVTSLANMAILATKCKSEKVRKIYKLQLEAYRNWFKKNNRFKFGN